MKKPYYNSKYLNNQKIFQGFVNDFINFFGYEVKYIDKKYLNVDNLLGEINFSRIDNYFNILVYIKEGYYTSHGLNTNLLNLVKNDLIIYISKDHWKEATNLDIPRIEDLIYIDFLSDKLFEIKSIDIDSLNFYHGNYYVYELYLETYRYYPDDIAKNIASDLNKLQHLIEESEFLFKVKLNKNYKGEEIYINGIKLNVLKSEESNIFIDNYINLGSFLTNSNNKIIYEVIGIEKINRKKVFKNILNEDNLFLELYGNKQ